MALMLAALAVLTAGCVRRYVANPEEAMRGNDLDWKIESPPRAEPENVATP
jgi:hypothetical protein